MFFPEDGKILYSHFFWHILISVSAEAKKQICFYLFFCLMKSKRSPKVFSACTMKQASNTRERLGLGHGIERS